MFYLISYTDSTSLYCDSEYLIVMAAGEVQLARPTPYCTLTGRSFMTCHLHKRKAAVIIHMFTCIKRSIHRGYRTSLHISLVPRLFINTTLDIYFNCVILLLTCIDFSILEPDLSICFSFLDIVGAWSFVFFCHFANCIKVSILSYIFLSAFLLNRNFFLLQCDSAYCVVALPYSVTLLEDKIPHSCQNIWK